MHEARPNARNVEGHLPDRAARFVVYNHLGPGHA